ncbi:Major_facilitator superfamily protein [Hexamita inflata]|uniref:Lysosomal dipeptide transporter MFSD1 n=1 Tax=Hexamita inflata TaxID=28002 RepID=A0AA86QHB7_9EUKA|nr:Major facilitator superfamily protein [Hexamita inflata]CAI9959384.1 Major facilitator superfamily protein [Hexamita inflata]
MKKELPMYQQILHILVLSFMLTPNLMFNASVNALSPQLKAMFQNDAFNNLCYTTTAVPAIFSLIIVAFIIDAVGARVVMPILQLINLTATIISIVAVKKGSLTLFLVGRGIFGLGGETTYTGQSKIFVMLLSKNMQPIAYTMGMAAMIAGDLFAVLILPISGPITNSYVLILGLQVLGTLCVLFYSYYVGRYQKEHQVVSRTQIVVASNETVEEQVKQFSMKEKLITTFKQIKNLSVWYWTMAACRIISTAIYKVYDSRSVISLSSIFNYTSPEVKRFIVYQNALACALLVLLALVQYKLTKVQYVAFVGQSCMIAAMLVFTLSNKKSSCLAICLINGVGLGLSVSTTNSLIVGLAGTGLGASAVGFVYSFRFVIISILTPVAQKIAAYAPRDNGWMYFGIHIVSLLCLILTVVKKLGF